MMPRSSRSENGSVFDFKQVRKHKAQQSSTFRPLPRTVSGYETRGRFVGKNVGHSQKVSVSVAYKKFGFSKPLAYAQSLRVNAAYITREGVLDVIDEKGDRLTLEEVDAKTRDWDDDQRYYRFIISPEQGNKLDLDKFGSGVMEKVREDLLTDDELRRGVQVEWVMAQHWDTNHPHVHVMMRAKVEDRDVRLSAGYASHGLRSRAEEVATSMLGYRRERWQDLDLTKEQQEERKKAINEQNRPLLMARRAERGLDPETGRHPEEKTAAGGGKAVSKSKEASRSNRGFDGGLE